VVVDKEHMEYHGALVAVVVLEYLDKVLLGQAVYLHQVQVVLEAQVVQADVLVPAKAQHHLAQLLVEVLADCTAVVEVVAQQVVAEPVVVLAEH
jgi:hypothetical protein